MAKQWIKPKGFKIGNNVTLLCPASPVSPASNLKIGMQALEAMQLNVHNSPTTSLQYGYLAGSDAVRRQQFEKALTTPSIKGIITARGGYGSTRLLENLDKKIIRINAKILTGYSDITALHLAFFKERVFSYWSPMPATSTGLSPFSKKWFSRLLFDNNALLKWPLGLKRKDDIIVPGATSGRLTGGTLTLLAASIGTWYELETRNNIIFIEDIDEEPYKIDRMLTQLLQAGKLKDARAILIGQCKGCNLRNNAPSKSFTLKQVISDRLGKIGIPIVMNFPIGHIANQYTLPYGAKVRLDTKAGDLQLLEHVID